MFSWFSVTQNHVLNKNFKPWLLSGQKCPPAFWQQDSRVNLSVSLRCGLFLTWRCDLHIHYSCLKSGVEWYGEPSYFLIKSTSSLSTLLIVAEPMVTGKSNRSLFISITGLCATTAWKEPISHGRRTNTPLRVSVASVLPSFYWPTSSWMLSSLSSLSFLQDFLRPSWGTF